MDGFSKTKRRVFEAAVDLFATESFETVTVADIAEKLGRKKPSIYSHFESKQEILDVALDFFAEHFFDGRRPLEGFNDLIENASLLEVIRAINFVFVPEYDLLLQKILRIVHQRKYFDPKAQAIFQDVVIDRCIAYGKDVLDYLVAKGRVEPFDTMSYSLLLNYIRQGIYMRWVLNPTAEHYMRLSADEERLMRNTLLMIKDNRPEEEGK